MFQQLKPIIRHVKVNCQHFNYTSKAIDSSRVWVITDGGIESTLQSLAVGKQLAGSSSRKHLELKTMVINKKLEFLPVILQKYFIEWQLSKHKKQCDPNLNQLPWFLTDANTDANHSKVQKQFDLNSSFVPDFIVTSGHRSIPACLYYANLLKAKNSSVSSVYVGYPNIPFIHFDQVCLPKYEANGKMAHLGPLARQKNGIIAPAPLVDNNPTVINSDLLKQIPFDNFTSIIVGGHSPYCRWYSEDAVALIDNVKRIVQNINERVVIVLTEKTTDLMKTAIYKTIKDTIPNNESFVYVWDSSTQQESSNMLTVMDKIDLYESIIQSSKRVILTADLDYACAHAIAKGKPTYIAFLGRCRSYLTQFYRWVSDAHLIRKLRLEKGKHRSKSVEDPFSYLGIHPIWGNANRIFQFNQNMSFVKNQIVQSRQEEFTGKRSRK